MLQIYELWKDVLNRQPMAGDLQDVDNEEILPTHALLMLNRQPLADDLDVHDFFSISFSHHCEIMSKTSTVEERVFYIHQRRFFLSHLNA